MLLGTEGQATSLSSQTQGDQNETSPVPRRWEKGILASKREENIGTAFSSSSMMWEHSKDMWRAEV